jgi:hypothetical protein
MGRYRRNGWLQIGEMTMGFFRNIKYGLQRANIDALEKLLDQYNDRYAMETDRATKTELQLYIEKTTAKLIVARGKATMTELGF